MVCDCCKRKKRLFESFERIVYRSNDLYLCVQCSTLFYKLKDYSVEGDKARFEEGITQIKGREKDSSKEYLEWKDKYITDRIEEIKTHQRKESDL